MAYTRGSSNNIIVGAAALFTYDGALSGSPKSGNTGAKPLAFVDGESYKETLADAAGTLNSKWRNVGYTSNGLDLEFQPSFGEVKVDQVLDVARLFKDGMQVSMKTSFAEATLENLLVSVASQGTDLYDDADAEDSPTFDIQSGGLGDVPLERGLIAVGPGTGDPLNPKERIYIGYRALSIQNVTVSAKRDAATMFDVTFRMLPIESGSYGKIIDRAL
jgi:hypothetical protein